MVDFGLNLPVIWDFGKRAAVQKLLGKLGNSFTHRPGILISQLDRPNTQKKIKVYIIIHFRIYYVDNVVLVWADDNCLRATYSTTPGFVSKCLARSTGQWHIVVRREQNVSVPPVPVCMLLTYS